MMGGQHTKRSRHISSFHIVLFLTTHIILQHHGANATGLELKENQPQASALGDRHEIQTLSGEGAGRAGRSGRARRGLTWAGTKWCGPGHTADTPEELGSEWEADTCCREHDWCPQKIKAFKYRYHRWNWRTYTISLCACDVRWVSYMYATFGVLDVGVLPWPCRISEMTISSI